jgi:UDP-N-acetylmuramate dehydrogenase
LIVAHGPRTHESLAAHTSLKVGGAADWYSEPRDLEELRADIAFATSKSIPAKIIGGGSNLLVSDDGIEGVVVRPRMNELVLEAHGAEAVARVAAGASIGAVARRLARQGWSGLEWAATVPGSVGGAVVNNSGAFGSSMADCLISASLLVDGREIQSYSVDELGYGYRTSRLKRDQIGNVVVLEASFALLKTSAAPALGKIQTFQAQRTATQPRTLSAGSVFANPPGDYSGRLLESAGAKGLRRGQAEISSQHANFIVNIGGATATDVFEVMVAARSLVWQRHRVLLQPEIELAGRWDEAQRLRLCDEAPPS